jgi:hypothetical protein
MVSWLHIFWVAPAFFGIGLIVTGLWASAGPIKSNENDISRLQKNLYEAENKLARMCDDCFVASTLDAKMRDIEALLETQKTLKRSNSQMRGTLQRLWVKGRLGK